MSWCSTIDLSKCDGPRLHVQIGELLAPLEVVAVERERDLERRQRALALAELVEAHLAERRPHAQPLVVLAVGVAGRLRPRRFSVLAVEARQLLPLLPIA